MVRRFVPVIGVSLVAGAVIAAVVFTSVARAQQPAQQPAAPAARTFGPDAGLVLNFVKADKTADFEAVMAKLKEALQKSPKPERKQMGMGMKLYKSVDPPAKPGDDVLYFIVIDPPVKDADYTVSNILAESFPPADVNKLYEQYAGAIKGLNYVNLAAVSDFSK